MSICVPWQSDTCAESAPLPKPLHPCPTLVRQPRLALEGLPHQLRMFSTSLSTPSLAPLPPTPTGGHLHPNPQQPPPCQQQFPAPYSCAHDHYWSALAYTVINYHASLEVACIPGTPGCLKHCSHCRGTQGSGGTHAATVILHRCHPRWTLLPPFSLETCIIFRPYGLFSPVN